MNASRYCSTLVLCLVTCWAGVGWSADEVRTLPDRQVRPGADLILFGAAGSGGFADGSANGQTYTWTFAPNADVAITDDGDLSGIVVSDRYIPEVVQIGLLNGSTRELVRATLTVDDGAGGVASSEVVIDVVDPANEISDTSLESLAIEVNIAIEDGLRALYLRQQADGRWRWRDANLLPSRDCGTTGFALWALSNRGHGPLADSIYAPAADAAVQFILSDTVSFDPAVQANIGDPDADGNDRAIDLCPAVVPGYAAPIAAAGLIAAYGDAPNTVIAAGPYAGETVFQIMQDVVDWIGFAQNEGAPNQRGGWRYRANFGSSDTSIDSWNYLALEGFESEFGGVVPDAVKAESERRIVASQAANGAFGYSSAGNNLGTANARTGGALSGLLMVSANGRATPIAGDTATRIADAAAWLGSAWELAPGVWAGNRGNFYAMWTQARGLRLAGIAALTHGGVEFDWETGEAGGNGLASPPGVREGYFPFLVRTQAADGTWAPTVNIGNWTRNLNTAWGVLILTPTVFGPPNAAPICVAQDAEPPVDDACAWSIVAADVDGGSSDPDGDPLSLSVDPDNGVGLDPTQVILTADDGNGASASCEAEVRPVDEIPPTIQCRGGGESECKHGCGSEVRIGAQAADNCGPAGITDDRPECFELGTTTVTFTATDGSGNAAACTADVEVVDTRPPTVVVGSPTNEIWPPNHKCVEYDVLDACEVSIADQCVDPADLKVMVTGIVSDEPFEVGAGGDGHHADDMEITGMTTFKLRSERQGGGNGRFYTVNFVVGDPSGNRTRSRCQFVVPHDQSPRISVNDGPAEVCGVDGDCRCLKNPQAQRRARGRR